MQCKWLKHGHNLQSMFHVRELTHLNDQRLIERDKFKGREKAAILIISEIRGQIRQQSYYVVQKSKHSKTFDLCFP